MNDPIGLLHQAIACQEWWSRFGKDLPMMCNPLPCVLEALTVWGAIAKRCGWTVSELRDTLYEYVEIVSGYDPKTDMATDPVAAQAMIDRIDAYSAKFGSQSHSYKPENHEPLAHLLNLTLGRINPEDPSSPTHLKVLRDSGKDCDWRSLACTLEEKLLYLS